MIQLGVAFFLSFLLCYLVMPSIMRIARARGVVDRPDYRSSHAKVTPSLGGIGIFFGFSIVLLLSTPFDYTNELRYLLPALTIIFLVGARDDLDPLSPWAKLVGQLIGIGILIGFADLRIDSLYGVFGLYELPLLGSYLISTVAYIFLINSFNLIDGIDGLCASISTLILGVLGTWFALVGEMFYALVALTAAGATLAFLKYNISPSKIFMGDTGSLLLGTLCSVLVIKMLTINGTVAISMSFQSSVSVAIGMLIIPAFDTARVFLLRLIKGKSPFLPDRNHIHHMLLKAGCNHMEASGILLGVNILFVIGALQLQGLSPTIFLMLSIVIASCFTAFVYWSSELRSSRALRTDP